MKNHSYHLMSKEIKHSLKHIKLVIDMFETNNNILKEPENTIFIIVYTLLACMAGKLIIINTGIWIYN